MADGTRGARLPHAPSTSAGRRGLLLLAAALLLAGRAAGSGAVMQNVTDEPPPGCECSMASCCAGGEDCFILRAFAPSTGAGDVEGLCEPYVNGTLDGETTVCDAILQDEGFAASFVNGSSLDYSLWTGAEVGLQCEDLVTDTCPPNSTFLLNRWVRGDAGACSLASTSVSNTMSLVASLGCSQRENGGELDIYEELALTEEVGDLATCPTFPDFQFSDETASGPDGKRWMCFDLVVSEKDLDGAGGVAPVVNATTARFLYISLGRLPCGGDLEPVETPPPMPPPDNIPPPGPSPGDSHAPATLLASSTVWLLVTAAAVVAAGF